MSDVGKSGASKSGTGKRGEPRERITRVVEGWFLTEPLLFAAWTMHEVMSNPGVATIRVGRGKIEFNPAFVDSLKNEDLRQVLAFETMRILLGHPYSRRQPNAEVSYAASNLSVQECLLSKLPIPRAREVLGGQEYDHQYFEFYYGELCKRQAEDDDDQQDEAETEDESEAVSEDETLGGDNESAEADPADELEPSEGDSGDQEQDESGSEPQSDLESYADPASVGEQNTQPWESDDLLQEEISVAIQEAAEGDGWGTLRGHARERLKATLKPPLDYRGVLRQFRQSVLSVDRKLTRMKPSRRYGFEQMGSRYDFTTAILFAVDVSGSMSREDLQLGFSVINRFFQYGIRSIDVVWFDTEIVAPPVTFRRAKHDIEISGRGGTDFQCLMDFIDRQPGEKGDGQSGHKLPAVYDGLVVFTDGQAPVPKPPLKRRAKILWLFHTQDACERMAGGLRPLGPTAYLKSAKASIV